MNNFKKLYILTKFVVGCVNVKIIFKWIIYNYSIRSDYCVTLSHSTLHNQSKLTIFSNGYIRSMNWLEGK